ncbi:EMILIN-3 [Dissostichus eleginoides]|uniref:EMILIN-3 n=1 Tax=Dissostichus eleginoides TaxID=100907 RepID=A0AAD9CFI9_DISEL|nr:EMILIN-3 [Dissostichus eleginoides]
MHFVSPLVLVTLFLSLIEAKFYRPLQFNQYKAGPTQYHEQGKPTSRHKNHCAYVVEKTVSFTVQDGAAPYVKADYNKCSWGQKCPTLQYRLMYKPLFKVAHKTVTELEWRCCPGYSGYGCMEGHPVYQHPMKMMPPFKGPPMKGPQFKGPPMKGPQFKGPQYKGPVSKGPMFKGPMFKGPPINMKANPWSQKGPPTGSFNYQMRQFGPPRTYPETSFEPESMPEHQRPNQPEHQEPHHTEHEEPHHTGHEEPHHTEHKEPHHTGHEEPHHTEHEEPHHTGHEEPHHTEHEEPHHTGHEEPHHTGHEEPHHTEHEEPHHTEHEEPHHTEHEEPYHTGHEEPHHTEHEGPHHAEHNQEHDQGHGLGGRPEDHIPEEIPARPSGGEQPEGETIGQAVDSETEDRIYRMEEDVQRLNRGLETLRGTVNGLEESLRASLREDANRMLSALLSAAPGAVPGAVPAPAGASGQSTVGFVEISLGGPEAEGLDGRTVFPGLTELNGRVEELRTVLQAKTLELQELKATVTGHGGALKKMSAGIISDSTISLEGAPQISIENLMDGKLSEARSEILGGFEVRVKSEESKCEEKAGDLRRQCQREQSERQEQMEDALEGSNTDLRSELRNLQTQIQGLKASGNCSSRVGGLVERVHRLETSVAGLNQSQGHLRVELGGHKDHIEGMLEGRLGYVEAKLNVTGELKHNSSERGSVFPEAGQGVEARMEGRLLALEDRLLTALEELGNSTSPALQEGHAVPALETEMDSIREGLEVDVDRLQRQLSSLETRCTSSSTKTLSAIQGDSAANPSEEQNVKDALDMQGDRLKRLNVTLQNVMKRLHQQEQAEGDYPVQGELTILKFNVRSVNHTLKDLQETLGTVVHQVGQANSSWQMSEASLAKQIKGVVQLVGHQAAMLGAGERRLTRVKGELQGMRRRLAEEVRGCRSTAMGVRKEVTEVGGRVTSVEDQCKGLSYLAEDLERIREELEKQSSGLLVQVNGTLSSHAQQLSELRGEVRNCTAQLDPTQHSSELEPRRGDTFALN